MKNYGPYLRQLGVALLVVGSAALLQTAPAFEIGGLRPNLALTALIVLSFFLRESISYFTAVFFALIILRFRPDLEITALGMAVVALGAFLARNLIPGKPFINNLILIALGTILFYAISEPNFLLRDTITVFEEIAYNAIIGTGLFFLAHRLLRYEEEIRFTL